VSNGREQKREQHSSLKKKKYQNLDVGAYDIEEDINLYITNGECSCKKDFDKTENEDTHQQNVF